MASSAENPNSFTGPTIPWSSVIPTLWHSISGRVSIVRFGNGASAFCWLAQQSLAPTDLSIYPFTGVLLDFSSFFMVIYIYFFFLNVACVFFYFFLYFFLLWFIYLFIFLLSPHFFPALFLSSRALSHLSMHSCNDNKFVLEFIAWVMVIMLVHSTRQECIHVCA